MHPYALEICEPVKTWVERSVVPHVQLVLKILPHIVFLIKFGRKWIKNYVLFLFIRFFFLKYINLQKSKIWQTYLKITYLAWIPFHGHRISLAQWTAAVHLYHTSHLTGVTSCPYDSPICCPAAGTPAGALSLMRPLCCPSWLICN